jgi:hypothetical protein
MSLYDYQTSRLIMAALRKADSTNAAKLRAQWPDICDEMQARYDAPGGVLQEGER